MKLIEVEILQSREGAVSYTAGSTAFLPYAKAISAEINGWARIISPVPDAAKVAPKVVAPSPMKAAPSPSPLASIEAVLARFDSDPEEMKAFAKEKGINTGRAKSAKALAKAIAKHYK